MKQTELKKTIESIALKEGLKVSLKANEIDLGVLPNSLGQERSYIHFWQSILKNYSQDISEVTFNYQEKSTKIPLTIFEKIKNYFGVEIEHKEIPGKIKEKNLKSILINEEREFARIIADKSDWKELNYLSKQTNDFISSYVVTLENLCHRMYVPLELITKMKLKE